MAGVSLGPDDAVADPVGEGLGPENNESKPFPGLSAMNPAGEDGVCRLDPLIMDRRPEAGGSLEEAESCDVSSVSFRTVKCSVFGSIEAVSVPSVVAHFVVSTVVDGVPCTWLDISVVADGTGTLLLETDDIWESPCKDVVVGSLVEVTIEDDELGICCGGDTTSLKTESMLFAGSLGAAVPGEVDKVALPPAPGV